MTEITITKLDAARRHLRMAIELWFADADPVPTHSLARAGYQVIHDLNKRKKGPELLLDFPLMKDEYKAMLRRKLTEPSDFMKHADRGRVGQLTSLTFDPELTAGFIMFALIGLGHLKQQLATEEIAFQFWHRLHKSELFTESWQKMIKDGFDAKAIAGLRAVPKNEFLQYVREIVRKGAAGNRLW